MLMYLMESGAWSLGGLVIGYVLGRMDVRIRNIEHRTGAAHDDT